MLVFALVIKWHYNVNIYHYSTIKQRFQQIYKKIFQKTYKLYNIFTLFYILLIKFAFFAERGPLAARPQDLGKR